MGFWSKLFGRAETRAAIPAPPPEKDEPQTAIEANTVKTEHKTGVNEPVSEDHTYEIVTDIDGNVYKTVKIRDQVWMAENLKVTHYRNGDSIPVMRDDIEWDTGAYCDYNNDEGNADVYGRLYIWYAVVDERNIAPDGWHVPTDEEWQQLIDYLGGDIEAGGKLKQAGNEHWDSPNEGASNESGFTALPGGYRGNLGSFHDIGNRGCFWSSSEDDIHGVFRALFFDESKIDRHCLNKAVAFSVRCVKD